MERKSKMSEPQIIKSSVFTDTRGFFSEVLKEYESRQINMSWSIGGTFRGIHAQRLMDKAMWVASGEATIFAVNLDPASALFGQVIAEDVKAGDGKVFYAPWWWGRGFLAKTDCTIVYATTDVYRPEHEIAISYLGLPKIQEIIEKSRLNLIISEKDQKSLDIKGGLETIANWKRAGDQIAAELE
jgi:dTDP-4-dehydrorhamnose 3,5-epimerase-like enzyme